MEKLLQYAWQHRLWRPDSMTLCDGRRVEVLDPGWLNTDSGPDFFNAKIRIDNCEWAGNIEIHVKASDWYRHGHQNDPAYDSVIMHVVANDDMAVRRSDGVTIPQLRVDFDASVLDFYDRLERSGTLDLFCAPAVADLPAIYLTDWLDSLFYKRMTTKADRFRAYLQATGGDWERAFFVALTRSLGFGKNSELLERTALSVPLSVLRKHADSRLMLEAILLGQAGLIPAEPLTDYAVTLRREYDFLARKFSLIPIPNPAWQTGRMRPHNLPARRLATLAALLNRGDSLFSRILNAPDIGALRSAFDVALTGHWASSFNVDSSEKLVAHDRQALTDEAVNLIVINAVAPAIFSWAEDRGDEALSDRLMSLLESLPPEDNSKVRIFTKAGIACPDAFHSQALIELRTSYCELRRCLYCRFGARMLKKH